MRFRDLAWATRQLPYRQNLASGADLGTGIPLLCFCDGHMTPAWWAFLELCCKGSQGSLAGAGGRLICLSRMIHLQGEPTS
jgi:hypothetical protein